MEDLPTRVHAEIARVRGNAGHNPNSNKRQLTPGPCSIALNLNTAILNPNPSRTDTPEQPINPRGTWRVFFNKLI